MRAIALLLILAALAGAQESASRWNGRLVSRNKRHVLDTRVTKQNWLAFELKEVRGGEETLLCKGELPYLPADAHVLSGEPAVVIFGKDPSCKRGPRVGLLDRNGKLRWQWERLVDRNVWWSKSWWVDERLGKVVMPASEGLVRAVDLKSGEISEPGPEVYRSALREPWTAERMFDALRESNPPPFRPAIEPLARDPNRPAGVRLRAAIALHLCSGEPIPEDLWTAAIAKEQSAEEKRFAVLQAGLRMGDGALEFLSEAALRKGLGVTAVDAMVRMGVPAARALVGLLSHEHVPDMVKRHALKRMPSVGGALLRPILRELKDAENDAVLAGRLVKAAVATRSPETMERLQYHESTLLLTLKRETGPMVWLCAYFRVRPTTEAVKPLLRSLSRHRDDALRRPLIEALKACTGLDFGDDVDAWLRRVPVR